MQKFPGGPAIPTIGQGEQPTPEEMAKMKRARRAQLALQFMGSLLTGGVPAHASSVKMTAEEVFEYAMQLVEQVDRYIEPQSDWKDGATIQ